MGEEKDGRGFQVDETRQWKKETRMKGKLERRTMEAAETVPGKPKPATLDYRTSGTLVPEIPETQKSVKVEF